MRRLLLAALIVWGIAPSLAYAQDHTATVSAVKADLVSRGFNLAGPCGAFAITKRTAWALRDTGAGLLSKPTGNNCEEFATDIVVYPNGTAFDVLVDGGGSNQPAWNPIEPVESSRWRAALDPGDAPIPDPSPGSGGIPIILPNTDLQRIESLIVSLTMNVDRYAAQEAQADAQLAAGEQATKAEVQGVRTSLEEHRAEARATRSFVQKWLLERIAPVLGGLLTGVLVK